MVDVEEAIRNVAAVLAAVQEGHQAARRDAEPAVVPGRDGHHREGQPGVGFFIIANGTATVTVAGNRVRSLKAGDHFGEVALIDDGPRMAEVTAETDLECYTLTAWQFRPFVQDHPDVAWALMQSLVQRVVRDASPTTGTPTLSWVAQDAGRDAGGGTAGATPLVGATPDVAIPTTVAGGDIRSRTWYVTV